MRVRCYLGAQLVVLPLQQQHVIILCMFQNCPAGTNFRVEENSGYSVNRGFQIPICVTSQWPKLFPHIPRTSSARGKAGITQWKLENFLHVFRILVQVG